MLSTNVSTSSIYCTRVKCSPLNYTHNGTSTNQYCIMATLNSSGYTDAQVWNGYSWGNNVTVAANIGTTNSVARGIDIAWDNKRGWGMVITANNSGFPYLRYLLSRE